MTKKNITANEAWKLIFDKYPIIDDISKNQYYIIQADKIKEFKEPRLMSKWDSSTSLPEIFKQNKINMLSNSRSSYILGRFDLYEELPIFNENKIVLQKVEVPQYETIDIENISSEANALNVMILSHILDDFLGCDDGETVQTFNGRMGTGIFNFRVNTYDGRSHQITVQNAQCEIDGGFENQDHVVIIEAKNVVYDDFNIRQLYYPFRLWHSKVKKPIRLIFCVYYNMIYRIYEYRFIDILNYSSIELVKKKFYTLEDVEITVADLEDVLNRTGIKSYDKYYEPNAIPFIQANSFERVIALFENLYNTPMNKAQIASLMEFDERQSDYYFNAGKYLGLFFKNDKQEVELTALANQMLKMKYKERQLKFVELILSHKIFNDFFKKIHRTGIFPTTKEINHYLVEEEICKQSNTAERRSSSVKAWLSWIFDLVKYE